jgi:hypothetical protein
VQVHRRAVLRVLRISIASAIVLVGCGQQPPSASVPVLPTQAPPSVAPGDLDDAIRFRTTFGLRSDPDYVRRVAADPSSASGTRDFGVPLLPLEVAELRRRQAVTSEALPAILEYGARHADEFAGALVDQPRGGVVVVRFTGHLDNHKRSLGQLVGSDVAIDVQFGSFSQRELEAHRETIATSNEAWMASIPAKRIGLGVDVDAQRVILRVSSPHPNAPELVEAHFGKPEWLAVESDGTGIDLLRPGSLDVTVTDVAGRPIPGLDCTFIPDWNGGPLDPFGGQWTTNTSGKCSVELLSSGYWIRISRGGGNNQQIVAIRRAVVEEGLETHLTIIVTQ